MTRRPVFIPFTKLEVHTAEALVSEWQAFGLAPNVHQNMAGHVTIRMLDPSSGELIKVKVEKVVFPGLIFGKGRFIAYLQDDSGDGHDFVIAKDQRTLWPEVLSVIQGTSRGIPDGRTALQIAQRL